MGSAKHLILKFIDSRSANKFVKSVHYSQKKINNSKIHMGVFLQGELHGVMQYGCPIDKRRILPLVADTRWNGMLELNRMAFDHVLPKNSESRALAISFKLIKKHYPFVEWILSFSDACQCGDGTIYRASGFYLTAINKNKTILKLPDGSISSDKTFNDSPIRKHRGFYKKDCTPLVGFQLRYVYFLNKNAKTRLTVPIIPFSTIEEKGIGMYKGKKRVKHSGDAIAEPSNKGQFDSDQHAPIQSI